MTDTEILTAAIEKAFDNGWDGRLDSEGHLQIERDSYEVVGHANFPGMHIDNGDEDIAAEQVIFNQGFAKAIWGETPTMDSWSKKYGGYEVPHWQYHLQQMVVAESPIKYLGDNYERN